MNIQPLPGQKQRADKFELTNGKTLYFNPCNSITTINRYEVEYLPTETEPSKNLGFVRRYGISSWKAYTAEGAFLATCKTRVQAGCALANKSDFAQTFFAEEQTK